MHEFKKCKKCGSLLFYIDKTSLHTGIYCYDCRSFITWIKYNDNALEIANESDFNVKPKQTTVGDMEG